MSTAHSPIIENIFNEYAELQLRRYFLLKDGKDDDPDMEDLEARLESLWEKLDETQHASLNGMGADLAWVRNGGAPAPRGRQAGVVTNTEIQELRSALNSKDWNRALYCLRVCATTFEHVGDLAHLRGKLYNAIGFPGYANVFFEFAADLDRSSHLRTLLGSFDPDWAKVALQIS